MKACLQSNQCTVPENTTLLQDSTNSMRNLHLGLRMFGNACAWLANLANASCHNQIWYASNQLIASWCPYKDIKCVQTTLHVCSTCFCLFCITGVLWFSIFRNLAWAGYFTQIWLLLLTEVYQIWSKTMYTIQYQVLLCPATHKTVIHPILQCTLGNSQYQESYQTRLSNPFHTT